MTVVRRSILLAAVAAVLAAPAASADVLVSAPDREVECGHDIELGVWYQSYSGGPRWAKISVRSINGKTLASKSVRATTRWRYWYYSPRCGSRYSVRYVTPGGPISFPVRVGG